MEWSKDEKDFLKKFYVSRDVDYISSVIGRSPNAIRTKAWMMGFVKFDRDIVLFPSEKQIILGSLLGDMYCRITNSCKNAQVEEVHSMKQQSYLLWKLSRLESLSFNLRETEIGALHAESRVYSVLNYYYCLFYKNGKKQVNRVILDKLDALGLAVWYMDDGSYSKKDKNCRFYTNCFSYEENLLIKRWFEERWNLLPRIHSCFKRGKSYYFINFNAENTKKLISIIEPHIHESMKYKIGSVEKMEAEEVM